MAVLTLLACQVNVPATDTVGRRDRHLERVAGRIRQRLRKRSHDLVVLPELASIDYSRKSFDKLQDLAEPLDGPSFQVFGRLAREFGAVIVYGIPRLHDGAYRISQVAVDGNGELIGCFDKLHLAQYGISMEKEYFERGNHLLVFKHRDITIAPIICYDIRMPELARTLAVDQGVELILHCSAYGRDESFYSWHHFSICRAIENQVFFLSLNRAGENYGNSIFCAPWVDENNPGIRFPRTAEQFRTIEMNTELIGRVRKKYTLLDDRVANYVALTPNGVTR